MFYDPDDDDDFAMSEERFDVVRKILSIFNNHFDAEMDEILQFTHNLSTTDEEKFVTIHPSPEGNIVFCVLTPEQLDLVNNICEFSGKSIDQVVPELAKDGDIESLSIDPKDF
jgi:hypothetical protein